MSHDPELHAFLLGHLQAIQENDIPAYHATTDESLTLYEWWVTPHRLDGLGFHDFMMAENARRGVASGSDFDVDPFTGEAPHVRYELANLHIQRYNDTAIASYTLLISIAIGEGVRVSAHNESRVMVRLNGGWKVVHVHKSPAWSAPHIQP